MAISDKWSKATRSGSEGSCVEVRYAPDNRGAVEVRDSKSPERGSVAAPADLFAAFIADAKAGRFDL